MIYIFIGVAGIFGAILRYSLSQLLSNDSAFLFPYATFTINSVGCFALAYVNEWMKNAKNIKLQVGKAIGTGLIGSFTTFSTFSSESLNLIQTHHYRLAALYMIGSVVIGLLFASIGGNIARMQKTKKGN